MKCTKCGNEFVGERFCPVCGYPAELYSKQSDERRKYVSQFSDGYEDMDPSEETNRIMDHATQAQRYDSQFNSDYSQLFAEYAKDAENADSDNVVKLNSQEAVNNFNEEISSNSTENLASYEDSFEGQQEEEPKSKGSKTPVIVILVIVILALLGGTAWIIADTMGVNPFASNTATEIATQPQAQLPTSALTQPLTQLQTQPPTDVPPTAVPTQSPTVAPTQTPTEAPTQAPTMAPPVAAPTDAPTEQATDNTVVFPDDFVDEDNDGYDDNTDIYYGFQ